MDHPTRQVPRSRHVHGVPADPGASDWQHRYEQLLRANERLTEQIRAQDDAHRKALTIVKYEPSLPNNDVFTKQLVQENRQLLERFRALELRLAKAEGRRTVLSPRRSAENKRKSRKEAIRLPLRHASAQTIPEEEHDDNDVASKTEQIKFKTEINDPPTKSKVVTEVPLEVQTLVSLLKQRLEALDLDLTRLQEENNLLRHELSALQEENDPVGSNLLKYEEVQVQLRTYEQQQELEHLLHDRTRQIHILQEQFTHLQNKSKSKNILYRQSLDKVEQLTNDLFDTQQKLLEQTERLNILQDTTLQFRMLEKEIHVLKSENAKLNVAVGVLSARPLDALNTQLEKKAIEISVLEERIAQLARELRNARQDHGIVTQTNDKLRRRIDTLTQQLEATVEQIQALKAERDRSTAEREVAQLQLQFYLSGASAESKELMDAVGQALKQLRSEGKSQSRVSGGTGVQIYCSSGSERISLLQKQRTAKMAETAALIHDELRAQLHDLRVTHQAELRELTRKSARWETRANEYLAEIVVLQRARESIPPHTTRAVDRVATQELQLQLRPATCVERIYDTEAPVLSPDFVDPNVLEVCIFDLHLDCSPPQKNIPPSPIPLVGSRGRSYAVFCDYIDYESQHSPVFTADDPAEMEITYKILVDQSFCRSPIAHTLAVELHRLDAMCQAVVGVSNVDIVSLFASDHGRVKMTVKMLDPTTRAPIGSFRIAMTLAHPVSHLFTAWHRQGALRWKQRVLPHPENPLCFDPLSLSIRMIAFVVVQGSASTGPTRARYQFMGHPSVRQTSQHVVTTGCGYGLFTLDDRVRAFQVPGDHQLFDYLDGYEMALDVEIANGQRSQASIPFKSVLATFRTTRCASLIVSATLQSTGGGDGRPRAIGRVWVELQASDSKPTVELSGTQFRSVVLRVFGMVPSRSKIDWRRFCEAIQLTASERAVRQIVFEKTQNNVDARHQIRSCLLTVGSNTDLSLGGILEHAGIQLSRSELSFITGCLLLPDGRDWDEQDISTSHRRTHRSFQRLALVLSTADAEWLRVEPQLRRHVESSGAGAAFPPQNGELQPEPVDWETFVQRVGLLV